VGSHTMTLLALLPIAVTVLALIYIMHLRRIIKKLRGNEPGVPSNVALTSALDRAAAVAKFDAAHRAVYVNNIFASIYEVSVTEVLGRDMAEVLGIHSGISASILESIQGPNLWKGEIRGQKPNLKSYWAYAV